MASTAISNPVTNSDRSNLRRKKKKKIPNQNQRDRDRDQAQDQAKTEWKSDTQQQVYSSKLLQALRQVRINGGGASQKRGRAVREAADRVLAVAAKGRTRWSRAILTNRIKLKFMKKSGHNKRQRVTVTGNSRWGKKRRVSILRLKTKNLPAFQRKARVLGRLVPGCRKQSLPVILEEASDYIAALEMQVKAMSALTQLLSGAASSSNAAPLLNQLGSSRQPPAS
ncbi:hypothetical protein ACH5RR_033566 [Cinchona calisaya]|uniref:IBH1-like N-terminal domain-containing protein n=1 Tax=Cinchona calisaya TaxID=153742 RepID=A0ABD2YLA9_9GENT